MDKTELLERYEVLGEEGDFLAAKELYEEALATASDAQLLQEYGYLIECHGRNELRMAVEQYTRAVELDPDAEKTRYQLIGAMAALSDTDEMIALYEQRVAAAPDDVVNYRLLAHAHLAAHAYDRARKVIDAGLELAPDDRALLADRGEVKAGTADPDGALADWRRAVEPEDDAFGIGPLFSSAFLLEREGRLDEALATWRAIVGWHDRRGVDLAVEYPKKELERVRRLV